MKVRLVGSSIGPSEARQNLTTILINDQIAIDAGSLGLLAPVAVQQAVLHVLVSHSHIDHLATLPLFLDNVFEPDRACPVVYGNREVWQALHSDVFNERLWPDLARIAPGDSQFCQEVELHAEVPIAINGLTITPVPVDHTVPTLGFLIEDASTAVVVASDTCPTERLWELARRKPFRAKLRAVFLECSFPNRLAWLAEKSKHLCAQQFAAEIGKLGHDGSFRTVAVHLKTPLFDEVRSELLSLGLPNFEIGGRDQTWNW